MNRLLYIIPSEVVMYRINIFLGIITTFFIVLLGSCSNLRGAKLYSPEQFGLVKVEDNLYVERGADEGAIHALQSAMKIAETAVKTTYGSVQSQPVTNACITEECYHKFGGMSSKAKVYGDRILLSPRGLDWHFLAHEWSHDEMRTRLSFIAWCRLPQWFDEGVAVAVSQAPEHSEEHWEYLVASDINRPTREELISYTSLRQWLSAARRFGATTNDERKARGELEIHPLYSAAGHEVRPWLQEVGTRGLLKLIAQMNDGEKFNMVYPGNHAQLTTQD
ncbi:hypothetical protein [Desulfovibrio inopinatus]|uniref:hypothetical protein n=1 Tax=Desulfovibrio inopinatus TaxID=102109 RepID=UPI00041B3D0C|nr:hypothetical protein [Desulfovibrio inopinatus]